MKPPVKNISGQEISSRYDKYTRFKNSFGKPENSFTETMDKSSAKAAEAPVESASEAPSRPKGRSWRADYAKKRHTKFAEPRNITNLQARRLASYAPLIRTASAKHNVPVELICAVILQESGANPKAKSHMGASGLMQLMPGTAKRFGVTSIFDPAQNIDAGTKYLRFLLDRFNGKLELAIAGYNAGEGNVAKYGNKIPPFKETQNYVPAVLGFAQSMVNILSGGPQRPVLASTETLPVHARRV